MSNGVDPGAQFTAERVSALCRMRRPNLLGIDLQWDFIVKVLLSWCWQWEPQRRPSMSHLWAILREYQDLLRKKEGRPVAPVRVLKLVVAACVTPRPEGLLQHATDTQLCCLLERYYHWVARIDSDDGVAAGEPRVVADWKKDFQFEKKIAKQKRKEKKGWKLEQRKKEREAKREAEREKEEKAKEKTERKESEKEQQPPAIQLAEEVAARPVESLREVPESGILTQEQETKEEDEETKKEQEKKNEEEEDKIRKEKEKEAEEARLREQARLEEERKAEEERKEKRRRELEEEFERHRKDHHERQEEGGPTDYSREHRLLASLDDLQAQHATALREKELRRQQLLQHITPADNTTLPQRLAYSQRIMRQQPQQPQHPQQAHYYPGIVTSTAAPPSLTQTQQQQQHPHHAKKGVARSQQIRRPVSNIDTHRGNNIALGASTKWRKRREAQQPNTVAQLPHHPQHPHHPPQQQYPLQKQPPQLQQQPQQIPLQGTAVPVRGNWVQDIPNRISAANPTAGAPARVSTEVPVQAGRVHYVRSKFAQPHQHHDTHRHPYHSQQHPQQQALREEGGGGRGSNVQRLQKQLSQPELQGAQHPHHPQHPHQQQQQQPSPRQGPSRVEYLKQKIQGAGSQQHQQDQGPTASGKKELFNSQMRRRVNQTRQHFQQQQQQPQHPHHLPPSGQ